MRSRYGRTVSSRYNPNEDVISADRRLGERMSPWAGGPNGRRILSVSSYWYGGHAVPRTWVVEALAEVDANIAASHLVGWGPKEVRELRGIRNALRKKLGLRTNPAIDCGRVDDSFNRYQGQEVDLYGDTWMVDGCDSRKRHGEHTAILKSQTREKVRKVVAKRRLRDAAHQGRGGLKPRKPTKKAARKTSRKPARRR